MHSRRMQPPAHSASPADARSVPRRSSDVSCVAAIKTCSVRPRLSDVSCAIPPRLGASDAAPAAPMPLPARTADFTLGLPRTNPHHRNAAQRATASAYSTHHHPCTAGGCNHPLTAQLPPMHAAYLRGAATSAAASLRDSVPATLPQLLRCHCLHAPPTLGSPRANPTVRYSPASKRPSPHHPSASMHSRRSEPPAHSASPADARSVRLSSSDVSCVILKRLGANDAAPAAPIRSSVRTAAPRLDPRKPLPTECSPGRSRHSP